MNHDNRTRSATVLLYLCAGYLLIIGNLLWIQVKNRTFFRNLGMQQYRAQTTLTPDRAPIFDRSGTRPLAINRACLSAFIMPNALKQRDDTTKFLHTHFPNAAQRLTQNPHRAFMYVQRRLTHEQEQSIREACLNDIRLLQETSRFYPIVTAAPIVGLTNIDNHGSLGLEYAFDEQLAGVPAICHLERDARSGNFHFAQQITESGKPSTPLITSIDADIQFLTSRELQRTLEQFSSQAASAVIMDPTTGEIITLAHVPTFNPNDPQHLDINQTANTTISHAFELGSVMKVFTALAALEEGAVSTHELIDCQNSKTALVEGRTVNTWRAHGALRLADIIALSNNIGIATIASRLGPSLYWHYLKLGFGKKTNIELPGEQSGSLNTPKQWSQQSIMSLSYGYEVSATLLQLARAFCTIAHDGYSIQPTILPVTTVPNNDTRLYQKEHVDTIKNMLQAAVESGTARAARIPGYRVMCKTGTANMLDNGSYSSEKNMYTCAGIVEKESYKRVIVVSVKEGTGRNMFAATVAAPLFKRIARAMLVHERIV